MNFSNDVVKKLLTSAEYAEYLTLNESRKEDNKKLQTLTHKISSRYKRYMKNRKE